ncbi:MAG: transferase [Anaerolineae bacterium]|nr:transferase [Anaerolineae bacterium]
MLISKPSALVPNVIHPFQAILIIGAGGYGQVVADILSARPGRPEATLVPVGFLDDNPDRRGNHFVDLPIFGPFHYLTAVPHDGVFVAIEPNQARQQFVEYLLAQGERLVSAIHPSAVIGAGVTMGAGTIIGPGAVVNTGAALGRGVIVNANSTVGHHSRLADYVYLGSGAQLGSGDWIGAGAFIGAGAIITAQRQIQPGSIVPDGMVVY